MRVIAGEARGRTLLAPRVAETRPTTDRLKEAMFSAIESILARARPEAVIGSEEPWEGLRVLDLYAGTGALGIEALSRGAAEATFVESNKIAAATLQRNLEATGFSDRSIVRILDVRVAVATIVGQVDLILIDPPYAKEAALAVISNCATSAWMAYDAILVLEHDRRLAPPGELENLVLQRTRLYGSSGLSIFCRGRYDRAQDSATHSEIDESLVQPTSEEVQ